MQVSQQQVTTEVPVTTYQTRDVTRIIIDLADAGEVRRFHRQLLIGAKYSEGERSVEFANRLNEALGVTEESAAKQ